MGKHGYDLLRRALFAGGPAVRYRPSSGQAGQFAGRCTVASGTSFTTVSMIGIGDNDLVFASVLDANSGSGPISVNSVVPGVSFALARQNGAEAGDIGVSWFVFRGEP